MTSTPSGQRDESAGVRAARTRELTDNQYWDSIYQTGEWASIYTEETKPAARPFWKRVTRLIKRLLGRKIVDSMQSYADYCLWDIIYEKHMPRSAGAAVLEIGSAPGVHLVKLRDRFGFVPYGIDRSETGVEINKRIFAAHHIDRGNVIHADLLSDEVRQRYSGQFDVVLSNGFVEHFADPSEVVARHVELLKPGGRLFVSIPNLRGLNYVLAWFFNRPVLAMHNIDIMSRETFFSLFAAERLSPLYCNYYGSFDFGLFNTPLNSPLRHVLAFSRKLQLVLNLVFRRLFRDKAVESRFSSPYLIYVGVKEW